MRKDDGGELSLDAEQRMRGNSLREDDSLAALLRLLAGELTGARDRAFKAGQADTAAVIREAERQLKDARYDFWKLEGSEERGRVS